MAQTTTYYGLLKPEATDNYNHLVYDNPNMDTIDATMKDNANHAIDAATCIKTGTVHSVTRSNTSCPVFRFTATGDWNAGDTMNVDGTPVSVFLPNGAAAITGAYVINTEVIASIVGTRVTLMTNAADASNIYFDPTGTTLSSNNVEGALQELNDLSNIQYDATHTGTDMINALKGLVVSKEYTTTSLSVPAYSHTSFNPTTLVNADTSMAAYNAIGIVGVNLNNENAYLVNATYANNNYAVYVHNTTGTALNIQVSYTVLFIKITF